MKIISRSRFDENVHHKLHFDYVGETNWGFSFPCDAEGNVDEATLASCGLENYRACLAGTNGTRRVGVVPYESRYRVPAVGQCPCGAEVHLANFTNTCSCGRDFNSAGQELAPRSQWGEETGEHWTECL